MLDRQRIDEIVGAVLGRAVQGATLAGVGAYHATKAAARGVKAVGRKLAPHVKKGVKKLSAKTKEAIKKRKKRKIMDNVFISFKQYLKAENNYSSLLTELVENEIINEEEIKEMVEEGSLIYVLNEVGALGGLALGALAGGLGGAKSNDPNVQNKLSLGKGLVIGGIAGLGLSQGKQRKIISKMQTMDDMWKATIELAKVKSDKLDNQEKVAKVMQKAEDRAEKIKKRIEALRIKLLKLKAKGKGKEGFLRRALESGLNKEIK